MPGVHAMGRRFEHLKAKIVGLLNRKKAPDTIASVKKGFKNVFHRKGRREGEASPDAPVAVMPAPGNSDTPVEAPSERVIPEKTPRLTTNIPGSSLGGAAPPTPSSEIAAKAHQHLRQGEQQQPESQVPPVLKASYAEGMRATSGPLGSSLEEVEEFERMVERRSSAKTEDFAVAKAASEKVEDGKSSGDVIEESAEQSEAAKEAAKEADGAVQKASETSESEGNKAKSEEAATAAEHSSIAEEKAAGDGEGEQSDPKSEPA